MHQTVLEFIGRNILLEEVHQKRVLEVGSFNVNGTVRTVLNPLRPLEYMGIDMRNGPCVDLVHDISASPAPGGEHDVVICCEMLEHAQDWRAAVNNMKRGVTNGGILLVTTRSRGFPLHDYPSDYWRFELADIANIFSDMTFHALESDTYMPGVLFKVSSRGQEPRNLGDIQVRPVQ